MGEKGRHMAEVAALAAVPVALAAGVLWQGAWPAAALGVALAALAVMALGWEREAPALRQLLPTVALASVAAAGRIAFAALPDVKPVSAVVILCGAVLGRRSGFLCGALAALLSNLFFGQGLWTPWQMYAWGLMGYVAGCLSSAGLLRGRWEACLFGFVACLGFGWVMDAYVLATFVRPVTWASGLATFGASLPFDLAHGAATAGFLTVFWGPWRRALERTLRRHGLGARQGR